MYGLSRIILYQTTDWYNSSSKITTIALSVKNVSNTSNHVNDLRSRPWLNSKLNFNFEIGKLKKIWNSPLIIHHQDLMYTDGSNNGDIISSTAAFRELPVSSASSIISTEANTILVAVKFVVYSDKK